MGIKRPRTSISLLLIVFHQFMGKPCSLELHGFIHSICNIRSRSMFHHSSQHRFNVILSLGTGFPLTDALKVGRGFLFVLHTLLEHAGYSFTHRFESFRMHGSEGFLQLHLRDFVHPAVHCFDLHCNTSYNRLYCLLTVF